MSQTRNGAGKFNYYLNRKVFVFSNLYFSEFVSCLQNGENDSCPSIPEQSWGSGGTLPWISKSRGNCNRRGSESSVLRQNLSSIQFSGSVPISFLSQSLGWGSSNRGGARPGFGGGDTSSGSSGSRRTSFGAPGSSLCSSGSQSTSSSTANLSIQEKVENRQEMECRQVFFDSAL